MTGWFPSKKSWRLVAFESALERDFLTLLEFDQTVRTFEEQPLRLSYRAATGRNTTGVPDFLVHYHQEAGTPTHLCDVTYRKKIFENWQDMKPRLRAARAHAHEHGWRYRILTEIEIRTPLLENARSLLPYRRLAPNERNQVLLLSALLELDSPATPSLLLGRVSSNAATQAELILTLRILLANGLIEANFDHPLSMNSPICLPGRIR